MSFAISGFETLRRLLGRGSKDVAAAADTIRDIEDQDGAMGLEQRYSLLPGSERFALREITKLKLKGRYQLILHTELGDRLRIKVAGGAAPLVAAIRASGECTV